jgi:hypothetical protein
VGPVWRPDAGDRTAYDATWGCRPGGIGSDLIGQDGGDDDDCGRLMSEGRVRVQ